MSRLLGVSVVAGLILIFSLFVKKFAWMFGVVMGMISSGFYSLSYIGIKCSILETFSYLIMALGLFVVIVRVYKAFK